MIPIKKYYILLSATLLCIATQLQGSSIDYLKNLTLSNTKIKALRNDVRKTIFTVKSHRETKELPALRFYAYNVRESDSFWHILTRTSLNIDTLMTVNALSSPQEIEEGITIYIPNMRGIVYRVRKDDTLPAIAKKFNIDKKYILHINHLKTLSKKFVFIPCGKISKLERSLFLGTGFASPLRHIRQTSGFGYRKDPFLHKMRFHKGVDLACPIGTNVFAARKGKVVFAGYRGGYGKLVILKHACNYHSLYGHLSTIKVHKGQIIKTGQRIALSGNTGRSTGPHLHFEIRKFNRPITPRILHHHH